MDADYIKAAVEAGDRISHPRYLAGDGVKDVVRVLTTLVNDHLVWREMGSAPRDGTRIFCLWPGGHVQVTRWYTPPPSMADPLWFHAPTINNKPLEPLLWMPLPPLPAVAGGA